MMIAAGAFAAALAVVGAGFYVGNMSGTDTSTDATTVDEPEPEPIDVTIPYDAAARLAYDIWRDENEKGDFDEAAFDAFSKIYKTQAVATAVLKKASRDLDKL